MIENQELESRLLQAVAALRSAEALLIGAGAGMGADSGLPDFRGNEGFWKAYPPFRGRAFADMSNPYWFRADPEQAWGFFGHRLNLYRDATPHAGFAILRRWGERLPGGQWVLTSNVDGQFQKAGFGEENILECHGSIHYLQCSRPCTSDIWSAAGLTVTVDEATIRSTSPLPLCPRCEAVARPNILMFGDPNWLSERIEEQDRRYEEWRQERRGARVVAVEIGAGLAIPTVRYECERRAKVLIRINPREPDTPQGGIALPARALDTLLKMDALL
jgi:NAD-dependent SIR2 family protein deacetylase